MSNTSASAAPKGELTKGHKKVIFASSLGTVFEWYDFFLYGSLAAIIAKQFFSGVNETTGMIFALLAFAAELPLYLLLKNALRRQRPVGLPVFITPSDRYSLPSGHTAAAFLMATVLAASFPLWAPLLFLWAILVGASRLLLGVHYLSDLVAGALLGGGCALWALGWSQG